MKLKRRRVLEVPSKIRSFINSVTYVPFEDIETPLKGFVWEFDKKCVKPRKDLRLEDDFLEADPTFPKEAVLQILRVVRIILENCANKHFYSSYEQHLSALLASADGDVVESSLQTLAAFLKKTIGKCCIRDASLTSKLLAISQGWGSKEEGLGLIACSLQDGCDSVAYDIGSTLHFEFYAAADTLNECNNADHSAQGLQIIHVKNISSHEESDLQLLKNLVDEYKVSPSLRFSLLTRLRFARAFGSLHSRQQYICIRLYAFIVLVHASSDTDNLTNFFNNEPEFVNELVSLMSYEELIPEKIRILGVLSLVALCQERSHQPTVVTSVTSGGHRGILASLMQKTINTITSETTKWSVVFGEALLSLVTVLVSSSPGSSALREAGFIPTLLPLLKDTNPQHLHLVSTAVNVLEHFMDYSNPAVSLFRDLGGLDDTITRLKVEVSSVEKSPKKLGEESLSHQKGKQIVSASFDLDSQPLYSESLVSYHRRLLIKALLRAISLGTYAPGTTSRIYGSEESLLPHCLSLIFRKAKDFGGGVFSLAATVMSDLIHKDPTCFPVLDAAGVPQAFLDAITGGVICSSEAIGCIPQCLDALCLNNTGLQEVKDRNALMCFVKIFTCRTYLRALSGDTPGSLSSGLDELLRHASSLRSSGVDMLIEILNTVLKMGSGVDASPSWTLHALQLPLSWMPTSMKKTSGLMVEASSDGLSMNVELFLPECVSNVARLLETILQNADTCRQFIERKGIEAVLQLFTLQLMPFSVSIGQNIAVAFKNFSPQHSASLSRALTNELMISVRGSKIVELETAKQIRFFRHLFNLDGLLSLSNFFSADADILKDLGKVYKEMLWQISLCCDYKADEKQDISQEPGAADASLPTTAGRESDDDTNIAPLVRYMNPVSVRNGPASEWNFAQEIFSAVRSAENLHRHGRQVPSRTRGGRTSRQLDASFTDAEGSMNSSEASSVQDVKKKSPAVLISEILPRLVSSIRSFHASLVKGLTARRRADHGSLSPASKNLTTALAKLFHEALSYSGHSTTGLEISLSVKCRYLGKVVDDMIALTFDSRRRSCNTAIVNSFYVNGTFKELLTTFEATSQLLWTLPYSIPMSGPDQGKATDRNKLSHSSWLLDTLKSYCHLLGYFANSSLLLSPSPSQAQLLVQPVADGLSIGLFSVPRDPEAFVRILQSQVLDVIFPIWNHPLFPCCNPSFITSLISIVTLVYSGVGDAKRGRNNVTGSTSQRLLFPPLDESSIASIVEMGFSRVRAEEALRSIGTNSVEMAMDWLFSHPEELVQEDVQLAQALALSLGNSSETSKEDNTDKPRDIFTEERAVNVPPVDDILSASMKLFQSSDSVVFQLTDLLVTLCNCDKGENRRRVVSYLIQQLKLCLTDFSKEIVGLCHILVLLLTEDAATREIAAENGVVSAALDILTNFSMKNESRDDISVSKCISALLLVLDNMLQCKPKVPQKMPKELHPENKPAADGCEKESSNVFERILGLSTGHLTLEESQRTLAIACDLMKQHVPAPVMHAVLQLCARITKTHALALQFLDSGGLVALFSLPKSCVFPGFESLASAIVRHLLEDPHTLQTAMELEIKQTLMGSLSRHAGRLSPRLFLTSMAPVISRDPTIFMRAAAAVCQLESSGGRISVVICKEKEREKTKSSGAEGVVISNECIKMSDGRLNDPPTKYSRSQKKVPAVLSVVIDQLLEIIMSYPQSSKNEDDVGSFSLMDINESTLRNKGKSKVDEMSLDSDNLSEGSAFAKVTFALKLMSHILLMYMHAVGVVLKRDSETSQLRGSGHPDSSTHGGILHHIIHELLPLSSDLPAGGSDEWKDKLSDKASSFLVVLSGRSSEGRRRVINELVKALSSFSSFVNNASNGKLLPNKKVLTFSDLINAILSKSISSSSFPGHAPGCSPDIAKTMIDGGMVQSLTGVLQVIDLDHPNSPKVVNLMLKALENLTRAANASDQLFKADGLNKKKTNDRIEDSNDASPRDDAINQSYIVGSQPETDANQPEESQIQESHNGTDHNEHPDEAMEQDLRAQKDFMREEMNGGSVLQGADGVGISFQVEHRTDDDMADEDDEDMGDDGDDVDDDDDEEDEDIAEEGAALMSLADTDVEDHNESGLVDEYNDDIDEDDEFSQDRVIEVRWREGLDGLDRLRILRGSGDVGGFIDVATEPFQGINADDTFHFRRPLGIERRRQSGRGFLEPVDSNGSLWPSAANSSRDLEAFSVGSFDVTHLYMFDSGFPSENTATTLFGDRLVGSAPPQLIDFTLGMDPFHVGGRRGLSDGRWTDDGQPQAGSQAAIIAQAVEEQFVSQLSLVSVNNSSVQRQSGESNQEQHHQNASLATNSELQVAADDASVQPIEVQNQEYVISTSQQEGNVATGEVSVLHDVHWSQVTGESMSGLLSVYNGTANGNERMHIFQGVSSGSGLLETIPESGVAPIYLQNDLQMQDCPELHLDNERSGFPSRGADGTSRTESHSSSHAIIDSGSTIPDSSDGHMGSIHTSIDVDMNGTDAIGNEAESNDPTSFNREDLSARQGVEVPLESNQVAAVNMTNEVTSTNAIDPTFLEALPDDSALPPDIQAEVLAQQQAQRLVHSQQAEGQPVDMDNASIIATFPPDLRQEVLLTSSEAVLSSLPSNFLAEAQMLRDRAASHYHARGSLFSGHHRLDNRRLAIVRQAVMDRGVGVTIGRRTVPLVANNLKIKELEGEPLFNMDALKALIRLLRLAQPLGKGLLQRLMLNLCAHSTTRANLIRLLLDIIEPDGEALVNKSATPDSHRLYGCQWNIVYGRSQTTEGLPPLVSRRVLEILTYLATNHLSVANILFFFDPSSDLESQSTQFESKEHYERKTPENFDVLNILETSQKAYIPLVLFLKLLNRPLFLRSNAHLEQVMSLIQVVVNNAVSRIECQPRSREAANYEAQASNGSSDNTQKGSSTTSEPYEILLQLPESDLRNLCSLLSHEGLSDKVYSLSSEVVKKLAFVADPYLKFFMAELASLAHGLSGSAVNELTTLKRTGMLGLSAGSMAGAGFLRVLQTLSSLTSSDDGNKNQEYECEQGEQSTVWKLNVSLDPLWQELSDCISTIETKLGHSSSFSSLQRPNSREPGGLSSLSPPLPPGTQRLLPFIEAFFVLCEKLQSNNSITQMDTNVTAREIKEISGNSSSSPLRCGSGTVTFARVAEKHRRLLNAFIRQNPGLLEKSLSMMLKVPRLIDFDNKRAYFRSRIRQQHDQHPSAPLRVSVRRGYVLDDSYNQLRMRSSQELKGRLTLHFQGEEGIDAGGLTREWYQLLSRVIFDKGALLFTTVGNSATFQPNPNSVYQTEHLSYFKFIGRVVAKALFDGQLLDVYFTRSFYKHILGVKVTYHDIEAIDPDYYKNLKWMLENDVTEIPDLTFSMDADEEKHILCEKTEVTDHELKPDGRNIRVTEETKHEYVDLVADHILSTAIRPQINSFLEGFHELIPRQLISIFNDKELELLISGLPEIDVDDLQANTEYTGYSAASSVVQWFWEVVKSFNKEDMARLLQFVTGTSKIPLEGFKALQGISGPQRFQIHKAYGAPERLPSAHTCFNQLDLPEYSSKEQLQERLLLAIHESSEGFGFG
ncbi:unnamed protein product [Spirodela intermedia]|uniref:HECT-type E3 ubiquitin transferase n=1 Tax=Spirodela intermedia TaxID=51605 RepID=A0A7I8JS98_SPIIN|nr:unnamed protein product [Spirodela intermedia]CAA6672443.1 unnamed protein product [Spirodela intermedia]